MRGVDTVIQAHVVSAFEQSLSNMTHRLQQLAANTDQKVSSITIVLIVVRFWCEISVRLMQKTSQFIGNLQCN